MERTQTHVLALLVAAAAGGLLVWVLGGSGPGGVAGAPPRPAPAAKGEGDLPPAPEAELGAPVARSATTEESTESPENRGGPSGLRAQPSPAQTSPAPGAAPEEGKDPARADPPARRLGAAHGVLLADGGAPLSGVVVQATPIGSLADDRAPASAVVDESGGWSLDLSPGAWRVFAAPSPRQSVDVRIVADQVVQVALPAPASSLFFVRLLDERQAPLDLPRARVRVLTASGILEGRPLRPGEPVAIPADPTFEAESGTPITLEVLPLDPRYRRCSVRLPLPKAGGSVSLALEPSPRLQLTLTLGADQPSVLLIVRELPTERPLHQRLGVGSTVDADDATLLRTTGIVEARGEVRDVLIEVGLDVDLPAPIRVDLTPLGGARSSLELTLLDPLTRSKADLRQP